MHLSRDSFRQAVQGVVAKRQSVLFGQYKAVAMVKLDETVEQTVGSWAQVGTGAMLIDATWIVVAAGLRLRG
jgi:hypothetical protein